MATGNHTLHKNEVVYAESLVVGNAATGTTTLTGGTGATQGGFWSGVGAIEPNITRFRDRVFVGDAAEFPATRSNTSTTWIPDATTGANWIVRDSQFAVMQDVGAIAIAGLSRVSDGDAIASAPATIGIAGATINDTTVVGRSAWSIYGDVQHQPDASITDQAHSFGVELALKNKGGSITGTPYGLGYGVHGIWIQCGGDASYGGASANPINSAITIKKGGNTSNVGILFDATALTGTDGVTGTGSAVRMARGHRLDWYFAGGNLGASIRSDIDTAGAAYTLLFDDNTVQFLGNNSKRTFSTVWVSNAVNGVQVRSAASGSPARIIVTSDDSNAGLNIGALGTGVVTMEAQLTTVASTTGKACLNLPTGAAPSSPVDGDIWREDNTNTGLKVRINGVTKTFTVS